MKSLYNFFNGVFENLYYSLIYENRYLYILEGLGNTIIMALFATIIGVLLGTIIALIINANIHTGKFKILRLCMDGTDRLKMAWLCGFWNVNMPRM